MFTFCSMLFIASLAYKNYFFKVTHAGKMRLIYNLQAKQVKK